MHQLIIFRGLPVSGKTALAKSLKGFLHIESAMFKGLGPVPMDEIIAAEKACLDAVAAALKDNRSVVVSNCFSKVEYLLPFMRAAINAGAEVRIFEAHKTFRGDLKFTGDEMDGYRNAHETISFKTVAGTLDRLDKERQRAARKAEILATPDAPVIDAARAASELALGVDLLQAYMAPIEPTVFTSNDMHQMQAAESVVVKLAEAAVAAGGKQVGDEIVFESEAQFKAFAENAVVTQPGALNGQG